MTTLDQTQTATPAASTDASDRAATATTANPLGHAPVGKLLLQFSVPAVIAMLANSLYNIVDTIFLQIAVPQVGAAVMQLTWPLMCIMMALSMLAGIGGNALAAIELGRGHHHKVEAILANTAILLFGLGLVALVAGTLFIDPLLRVLVVPTEIWFETKTFVRIICVFFAFQSLGMGMNNFLRTAGRPNLALATSFLGTVMCVILNALFVLVLGWGIAGSAWATVLGQMTGMVPVLWFFAFSKTAPFRFHVANFRPDIRLMGEICMLGMASFVVQAAGAVVTVVLNHVIEVYAATEPMGVVNAMAAISIVWKVVGLACTLIIGITTGAQPILGFNVGAQQWDRVISCFRLACIASFCMGLFAWCFFELTPGLVLLPFNVDPALADFANTTLRIFAIWLPFVGYQIMGSSYFQSSGQPVKAAILELTRQIIFLIPLYLLFPPLAIRLLGVTGLMGVTLCVPISDVLSFLTTTVFVVLELKKLRVLRAEQLSQAKVNEANEAAAE